MNGPKPKEKKALPSPPITRRAVMASNTGTAHTAKRFHASKTERARGMVKREKGIIVTTITKPIENKNDVTSRLI